LDTSPIFADPQVAYFAPNCLWWNVHFPTDLIVSDVPELGVL